MKTVLLAAAAASVLMADIASAQSTILVSCYRGPWDDVIWDRANPKFVQSLQNYGYSLVEATQIADAICRDPRLVDNPEGLAQQVRAVVKDAPRG